MTGYIKLFHQPKGQGFIIQDNGEDELFVHITACAEGYEPQEGDKVTYEVGKGRGQHRMSKTDLNLDYIYKMQKNKPLLGVPVAVNVDILRDENGDKIRAEIGDIDMQA